MVGTDMTMEFYNLVFMQFERAADGTLTPLPKPSVDTGLGLERLASILQDVPTNYDTDLLRPIIDFTSELCGKPYVYDSPEGFAMRVIADHARSTAFSIADRILPGNEGRNYVLRKIMRRAIYHGRHALGLEDLFFHRVTNFVVDGMRHAYPELEALRDFIERMVKIEEERFGSTLSLGLARLDALFATTEQKAMPEYGELARLYDTFGTPRDLIRVGLEERGFAVADEEYNEKFDAALRELQQASVRGGAGGEARAKTKAIYGEVARHVGKRSEFTGYEGTQLMGARVVALIKADEEVAELHEGEEGEVVLDRTPFYAEAGGQVGDTGTLVGANGLHIVVNDTVAPSRASSSIGRASGEAW
ncbi:MAG: alanine--tRNA ligase-related protein [Pyrinomonadaceae bacterium]